MLKSMASLYKSNAYTIVLVWTTLVIIEMYYIKTYIVNWRSRVTGQKTRDMQWNLENKSLLNTTFTKELEKRLKLLETMSYPEWLTYNNKNSQIIVDGREYPLFVFERVLNEPGNYGVKDKFLLRANFIQENLGLPYEELLKQLNYTFLFTIFSPHPEFLHTMFKSTHYKSGTNIYSYYTVDKSVNRPVKANAIGGKFTKDQDGSLFEGVIYVPYSLLDVEEQYANKYYDFISKPFLVILNIAMLVVPLCMVFVSSGNEGNTWLPYAFTFASFYYLLHFIDTIEGITNLQGEEQRVKAIDDGILSISFLAAVNVFIIQTLRDNTNVQSYYEAAILFMVGLILLLLSLYKITNYNRIDEMRLHRIKKQLLYNGSIYVNLFILIFYSVFIIKKSYFSQKSSALAYLKKSFTAK